MLVQCDQWDKVYLKKGMAYYPDNMLIRFIAKNYYAAPNRKDIRILDVGCGVGASTWFLAREGFSVAAIDSSKIAISRLKDRLEKEGLEAFIGCGDIAQLEFKEDYFDAIIDISSICYVPQEKAEPLMKQLYKVLKDNGKFFSITPAVSCAKEPFNNPMDDAELNARFQSYDELCDIFKDFQDIKINSYTYTVDRQDGRVKLWVVEATK